jgi:5-methylcytosine-specific restriction endonuclease McrA
MLSLISNAVTVVAHKVATAVKTVTSAVYDRASFVSDSKWGKVRRSIVARDVFGDHWVCKYTGVVVTDSSKLDVDHIVPLKYAWINGASKWDVSKRQALATDPDNLISVTAHINRSKGDDGLLLFVSDLNKDFYVKHWKIVTDRYGIKLSTSEKKVITKYGTNK